MKLKNVFSVLIAVAILAIGTMAFAAPNTARYTRGQAAIDAARAEVPVTCNLLGYTEEEGESKITFQDTTTLEYYYVDVITAIGKVKEIEVKGATFVKGSTVINKTPADIEALVKESYPDARNIVVELEKEGNNSYYEAKFVTDKFKAELDFNPATGVIIEREFEFY